MYTQDIDDYMGELISNREMAAGNLIVRKNGDVVYKEKWGDCQFDSIFRMMSMTKVVTAVGILKLMDQGKLSVEDEVAKFIPEFSNMRVAADDRYVIDMANPKKILLRIPFFRMSNVRTVAAKRNITIRDLLSHSSGLEQGAVGLIAMVRMKKEDESLSDRVARYTEYPLDFQPGTGTGYSPIAGFDILGRIIEIVSGESFETFLQKEICEPLEMTDTTFFLTKDQRKKLVPVYKRKKGRLIDVTDTKEDMSGFLKQAKPFEEGCGGLYSTLSDYDHLAMMLSDNGRYKNLQFLKAETAELMKKEGSAEHLEPDPGMVWGLGVKIHQNPGISDDPATEGTYGWSGAFGTHFFISPKDHLEAVFLTNRTDLGGSGSYISKELERIIFDIWSEQKEN